MFTVIGFSDADGSRVLIGTFDNIRFADGDLYLINGQTEEVILHCARDGVTESRDFRLSSVHSTHGRTFTAVVIS